MKFSPTRAPGLVWVLLVALIVSACASDPTPTLPPPLPIAPTHSPAAPQAPAPATETSPPPAAQPTETAPADTAPPQVPAAPQLEDARVFPDPGGFAWQLVASGLRRPTALADPNDGTGRLLVLEQPGLVRVILDGQLQPEPYMNLTDRVGPNASEQGLLGIALDPDFAASGVFYLNYTDQSGNSVISRFRRSPDGQSGDPGSEQVLLYVEQPYGNHNGGGLEFGPDGYLYIGLGDGGSGGDPQNLAQNVNTLLGKMLRIEVRGLDSYMIPADNPFAAGGGRQEIWATGLRNPWRYSFDRLTGDLFIADVGQNKFEEVNFLASGSPPGVNFGWPFREAAEPFKGSPPSGVDLLDPVIQYGRADGCSVTGGYVYRGQSLPEWYGIYLFGDYCTGSVWGLLRDTNGAWQMQRLFQQPASISSFGQDSAGELYLLDHAGGGLYRLERR